MSPSTLEFVYLLAEGVTDVTLLSQVLRRYFAMKQVQKKSELQPELAKKWLDGFKWPHGGDDIARLAVPAPVFMHREGLLVTLRNAGGISRIAQTLDADQETFLRLDWKPDAVALFLDADAQNPNTRFQDLLASWPSRENFPDFAKLETLEECRTENGQRLGVFVFPDRLTSGTLEDLLLHLGGAAFPELNETSRDFVERWRTEHPGAPLYDELRKPAGLHKARLSAMAALLKPGKNLNASLHDHDWVPKGEPAEVLAPLVTFLSALIGNE